MYSFGIHNVADSNTYCFLYHEVDVQKGSNEFCSFLWTYLKENISPSIYELIYYSNNADG